MSTLDIARLELDTPEDIRHAERHAEARAAAILAAIAERAAIAALGHQAR